MVGPAACHGRQQRQGHLCGRSARHATERVTDGDQRKLRERVRFLKRANLSALHAAVPRDALPPSLGGTLDEAGDKWWWVDAAGRSAASGACNPAARDVGAAAAATAAPELHGHAQTVRDFCL